jgi:Tfp pilus assembly protein PilX
MDKDRGNAFRQAEGALRQAAMHINNSKMPPSPNREPAKAPMAGMKDALRTLGEQNVRRTGRF